MDRMIEKGRTLRIRNAKGMTLRVCHGTGWITEQDDRNDYALAAGEERRIGTSGLTLVHAFDGVLVTIEGGRPADAVVELGGGYREYAGALWREQLAATARKALAGLRSSFAGALRGHARSA